MKHLVLFCLMPGLGEPLIVELDSDIMEQICIDFKNGRSIKYSMPENPEVVNRIAYHAIAMIKTEPVKEE